MGAGNYIKVTQGISGHANRNINQLFYCCNSLDAKLNWMYSNLAKYASAGDSILIFVNQKEIASSLSSNLTNHGFECQSIHGDLGQYSRIEIISNFRKQLFKILVATDVASRGLDIPQIHTVVIKFFEL